MDSVVGDVLTGIGLVMLFGFAIIGVYTVMKSMVTKNRNLSLKFPKKKDK